MGLLDSIFDSEGGRLGLGLLAAGSARADGAGAGQRLMEAIGSVDQWKQQQAKDAFMKMQMDNYKSEIAQRNAAVAKQAKLQDWIDKKLNGGGTSGAGMTSPVDVGMGGGQGLTVNGMGAGGSTFQPSPIPANANPGGIGNLSLDDVTAFKMMGGADLFPEWKASREGFKRDAGAFYDNPVTGKREYIADPTKGFLGDGTLNPNFVESQRTLALIPEKIKAERDFVDVPVRGADGQTRMEKMSREEYAQMRRGSQVAPASPSSPTAPQDGYDSNFGLDPTKLSPEQLAVLAKQDPAALQKGLSRWMANKSGASPAPRSSALPSLSVPSVAPVSYGVGESTEEQNKTKLNYERDASLARESSKAGTDRIYAGYDTAKGAADALIGLNEAKKAISAGNYGGTGAELKLNLAKGLQSLGFNVDPEKVTQTDYLQSQLGQGILSKAKTLGANPTDNDARIIREIVGSIGTDPQALNKLVAYQEQMYMRSIDSHNKNYKDAVSRGFQSPYDLEIKAPQFDNKPQPKTYDMLPPASAHPGAIATAPDGKTKYKSDGKKWTQVN